MWCLSLDSGVFYQIVLTGILSGMVSSLSLMVILRLLMRSGILIEVELMIRFGVVLERNLHRNVSSSIRFLRFRFLQAFAN